MLIVIIAGFSVLLRFSPPDTSLFAREEKTARALATAKAALIGYAIAYRDTHPGQTFGYLPCPDTDNDGSADTCDKDKSQLGRLPWKTLGLPALLDASSSCLWYAVSAGFVSMNKTDGLTNWDGLPQFTVENKEGAVVADGSTHSGAIAVIFAPGVPLPSNTARGASSGECADGLATAFLENGVGFTNALSQLAQDFRGALPDSSVQTVRAGQVSSQANNDQLTWISVADIFEHGVIKRADFVNDINTLIARTKTCLESGGLPLPSVGTSDSQGLGNRPPSSLSACVGSVAVTGYFEEFRDQLWYARCASAGCLVQGAASCNGALIFSGQRTAGQNRRSSSQRNVASNYFETVSTQHVADGTAATGTDVGASGSYYAGSTSDLSFCLI
jgi:hypothetical protein